MPSYKLMYFDCRVKAELARLLFTYQAQKFEDITLSQEKWMEIKPTTPFGQVPTLEIDGKVYTESLAINNHLAREFGLYGRSGIEMLEIDQVIGKVQDVWVPIIDWIHAIFDGAGKEEEIKETNQQVHFPKFLNAMEKILTANGTGFYVGKEVTYANLAVFDALDIEFPESLIGAYPKVKANRDMIKNHDRLKEYLASRKESLY